MRPPPKLNGGACSCWAIQTSVAHMRARCAELVAAAKTTKLRDTLLHLAQTWARLAAEQEAAKAF
jgi:hypothetical protein